MRSGTSQALIIGCTGQQLIHVFVRALVLPAVCLCSFQCNYGSYQGRCVICGSKGISDAFYCKECTILEKDRDGCPKIVNLGAAKTDASAHRHSGNSHSAAMGDAAEGSSA